MEAESSTSHDHSRNNDQNVETLFITNNVQEIKQKERKTRLDIERKKEELRQLVGERYHDMIEAADSVIKMKQDANNVIERLTSVQEYCQEVQQTHLLKGTGGQQAPPTIRPARSASAQMKLIIDTQRQIWCSLGEHDYLSASLCFLIMRNGSMRMRTMESVEWPSIMNQFTQRTLTFKNTIVKSCREYFKTPCLSLDNKKTIDSFISLLLVEGCGLEKVLLWFLEDRIATIERVFASNTKVQTVKSSIKEVIIILRKTILSIHNLFIPPDQSSDCTIVHTLNRVTDKQKDYCRNLIPKDLIASLPDYIINYIPQLSVQNLPQTVINATVAKWMDSCRDIISQGCSNILTHVTNLKSITSIRDRIHQLLSEPLNSDGDDNPHQLLVSARIEWYNACQSILDNQSNLYNLFIRKLLLDRARDILEFQLNEIQSYMKELLQQLVARQQSNPDDFVHDTHLCDMLWSTSDERGLASGAGYETGMLASLKMKAKGCTPQINYFCTSISHKLQDIVDDLNNFLNTSDHGASDGLYYTIQQQHGDEYPFDKFADIPLLMKTLGGLVAITINRFVIVVETIASNIVTNIDSTHNDHNQLATLQDRLLLLSRLCLCLIDFTPNLKHLFSLQDGSPWKPQQPGSWKLFQSSRAAGNLKLPESVFVLEEKANELLLNWSKGLSRSFCKLFSDYLHSENETQILASTAVWDQINITEETESGGKVSSSLRLPSQASVSIVTILYALCQEITRIGGHFVNRNVLKDVLCGVFKEVIQLYWEYFSNTSKHFSQQFVLQTLFDYRFISSILWYPSNDPIAIKHTELLDLLVSNIDPFDYDVFAPHLTRLLDRQLQRSTVMFGILFTFKEHASFFNQSLISSTTPEAHIIIPLSTSLPRVPLLPASINKTTSSKIHGTITSGGSNCSSVLSPSFFNIATALHHL